MKKAYPMKESECSHNFWHYKPVSLRGYKLKRVCDSCGKILNRNVFPAQTFEGFIRRWVHGKLTGKNRKGKVLTQTNLRNRYKATAERLYYEGSGRNAGFGQDTLAIKLPDGRIIGNASKLNRCGSYNKGVEAPAQRVMQQLEMALIPFNIFEEAKLDLFKAKIIEQGKTEELILPKLRWSDNAGMLVPMNLWERKYEKKKKPDKSKNIKNLDRQKHTSEKGKVHYTYSYDVFIKRNLEQRHFIGAMVLEVQKKYYLFDVDRRELDFYRFNAFLVELPKSCKNIKEAYAMLMPTEVKVAIKKGLNVKRQGEWFFVPITLPKAKKVDEKFKKIADLKPEPDNFDLNYNDYDFEEKEFKIDETDIKNRLSKINEKYQEAHKERLADYNKYRRKYLSALKMVYQSDPEKYAIKGQLKAGDNRPNYVDKFIKLPSGNFVKGIVEHGGREHEPLHLIGWHKPLPNTAKKSFQITGVID